MRKAGEPDELIVGTEVSVTTGVPYTTEVKVFNDGCSYCSATGVQSFATQEDWDRLMNDEDEDEEAELACTGTKVCDHCEGVGRVIGNGPLIQYRLRLRTDIRLLPRTPE